MIVSKLEDPYVLLLLGYTEWIIEWWLHLITHFNIHARLLAWCNSSRGTLFSPLRDYTLLALFAACITHGQE